MFLVLKFGAGGPTDWEAKYATERANNDDAYAKQHFVQIILRQCRPGMRVLDAGCGTGGLLGFLQRRGFAVAGVDASRTAVERARATVPGARIEVASIEALPFPDASFDAYLAIGSWEYLEQGPARAAQEASRVLKPGGLAFIEVPRVNLLRTLSYVPLKRLESAVRLRTERRFKYWLFTRGDIRRALGGVGFTVLAEYPHDLPEPDRHYGLWVDWPFLRGGPRFELSAFGRTLKTIGNAISPWTIATGMFIVAKKK